MSYVGIDLGSNSLRAVRMEVLCENGICKDFTILQEFDTTVRTAELLEQNKKICKSAIERIIQGLESLKCKLNITESDTIIALSTQAMRKAENRNEVLEEIYKRSGIKFQVISGDLEAKITSLAPKITLSKDSTTPNSLLLIDMGGASSEFILITPQGEFAKSFEIGIVSAKDRYKSVENLQNKKAEFLEPILEFIKNYDIKPKLLVANSGTPTMISALKLGLQSYSAKEVFNTFLTKNDFYTLTHKFCAYPQDEQIRLIGAFKADVLPFGAALFTAFMDALNFDSCVVMDLGLREGAVLAHKNGILS